MKVSTSLLIPSVVAAGLAFFIKPNDEMVAEVPVVQTPTFYPSSACFAPGTDPEVMERLSASSPNDDSSAPAFVARESQSALQVEARWTSTATNPSGQNSQGDPITVTWGIVSDETLVPRNPNPNSFPMEVNSLSNLRARLHEIYPGGTVDGPAADQPWFPLFEQVFADLSALHWPHLRLRAQ